MSPWLKPQAYVLHPGCQAQSAHDPQSCYWWLKKRWDAISGAYQPVGGRSGADRSGWLELNWQSRGVTPPAPADTCLAEGCRTRWRARMPVSIYKGWRPMRMGDTLHIDFPSAPHTAQDMRVLGITTAGHEANTHLPDLASIKSTASNGQSLEQEMDLAVEVTVIQRDRSLQAAPQRPRELQASQRAGEGTWCWWVVLQGTLTAASWMTPQPSPTVYKPPQSSSGLCNSFTRPISLQPSALLHDTL